MTTVLFDPEPPIPDDVALNGRRVQDKFGIVADAGFQAVPDVLLLHQHELGLRSEDLNVLLQIATHWYLPETMPFLDLDHREAHWGPAHGRSSVRSSGWWRTGSSPRSRTRERSRMTFGPSSRRWSRSQDGGSSCARTGGPGYRGVAQPDRAPTCSDEIQASRTWRVGVGGRRFKSCRRAHIIPARPDL